MSLNTKIFREYFIQHYRPLCLFALHYLKDIDNAEDIVQDCFTELWERKDNQTNIADIKPYLYTMVRNRCIDVLRKESLIDCNIEPSDLEGLISDEECEERSYDEARMWTAIDSLPEKCREVFLLTKRDGMKYEEIADRMNISVNTVKNQMNKALKIIKEGVHRIYMFFFG
ncbi:MAG: RNA polymerase sigma-70 factor [Phocaeicola sp.]|nr:RNA polymerase sigma-70 factor [Phocaeicola sp.]